jgi:hypothetical protein
MAENRPPLKVIATAVGVGCVWLLLWSVMTVPVDSARTGAAPHIDAVRVPVAVLSALAWGFAVAYGVKRVRSCWVIVPAAVLTVVAPCMLCVFFTQFVDDVHQARMAVHVLPMIKAEIPGVVQPNWKRYSVLWRETDPRYAEARFGLQSGQAEALDHLRKTLPRDWIEFQEGDPPFQDIDFRSPIVDGRQNSVMLSNFSGVSLQVRLGVRKEPDEDLPWSARRLDGRVPKPTDPERY